MIGVVLLAHEQMRRTAQLARHLSNQGCCVVVHIDARVDRDEVSRLVEMMGDSPNLALAPRRRCDWGTFSLVHASLGALRLMFRKWPDVTHVVQLSGACLPIKPIANLQAHLEAHRDVDFIESVSVLDDAWVVDGLSEERFTLYHPLPWRRYRWLFDRNVELQRRLRIRRKMPEGLSPRIGSQWWCLSRRTLDAILNDPELRTYCDFFRRTWIPDESFFQTLAAKHSDRITSAPLTFVRFDPQGKPHVFYDDHRDLLLHAEGFFARKIWRGAHELYATFLDPDLANLLPEKSDGGRLLARFERAQRRHLRGRRGLVNHGRHKGRHVDQQHETARPYLVIDGLERVYPGLLEDQGQSPTAIAHGYLFHPDRVEFAGNARVFTGNLSNSVPIRDHKQVHFLSKLIWIERRKAQSFLHDFTRDMPINDFLMGDPNANLLRLKDRWLLDLYDQWAARPDALGAALPARLAAEKRVTERLDAQATVAPVLHLTLRNILQDGYFAARGLTEDLQECLPGGAVLSSPTLPERFSEFLELVQRHEQAPAGLEILADEVARYDTLARVLRRKT